MAQRISYIIGFASYLALVSFLGWSNTFAFSQLSVDSVVSSQTYSLVKTLFNIGTYCVVAIWGTTVNPTKRSSTLLFGGALISTFLGAIITSLSAIYPVWFPIIISAGLIGIGQALFFLIWQLVFACIDCEKPYVLPALATGLGALLYLGIVVVSTEQILELVSIVFIPATAVFYIICMRASEGEARKHFQNSEDHGSNERVCSQVRNDGDELVNDFTPTLTISLKRYLWASFLVFMCVAFMWAMMRSYSSGPSVASDILTVIGRLVSAALILLIFHWARREVTVLTLFQFVFPVLAIGFILLPVFNSVECNIIVSVLTYTVHSMISIVAMVECRQLYLQEGISPLSSVGVAWGGISVVTIFGRSIGALSVDFNFIVTVVFIAIYVLFQVFFFGSKRSEHTFTHETTAVPSEEPSDILQFSRKYGLTQREEEVFELLLKGRTSKQIADKLFVSNNTVLTHLKSIYRKTGVHSKTQIIELFESEVEDPIR